MISELCFGGAWIHLTFSYIAGDQNKLVVPSDFRALKERRCRLNCVSFCPQLHKRPAHVTPHPSPVINRVSHIKSLVQQARLKRKHTTSPCQDTPAQRSHSFDLHLCQEKRGKCQPGAQKFPFSTHYEAEYSAGLVKRCKEIFTIERTQRERGEIWFLSPICFACVQ